MRRVSLLILIVVLCCLGASAQSSVANLTLGYNYAHSDQGTGYADLHGWFGNLTYNINNTLGLAFESDNYYGDYRGASQNQHSYTAGPVFTFNSSGKVSPFIQPMLGDVRSSSSGTVTHAFTLQTSGGITLKFSKMVGLQLTLGEYDLSTPNGDVRNSFSSKAGLQFSFGQR